MKIGIYGYGNLGKGVECAAKHNPDVEIVGVFTRRDPETVKTLTGIPVYSTDQILDFKDKIDVLIICGGSATDLPEMTPVLAENFNVIDSFDTHKHIPEHFRKTDAAAKSAGKTAIISAGWDPGMFSLARVYASSILPFGETYTFWGVGVSQGHSDAVRRIDGVVDARQYTVPVEDAMNRIRNGETPKFTARDMHERVCYVVAEEGADKALIEKQIKEMPNYFDEYNTTVNFISLEEMQKNHSELPHGGSVIRSGKTGLSNEKSHTFEFKLNLDSNPQFTSSVLVSLARAINRMNNRGEIGCYSILDVRPCDLSSLSPDQLRERML